MKKVILTIAVLLVISTTSFSQRVETLVKGPSTFDDGLAIDSDGFIYASRYYGNTITKISTNGETQIFSSGFGSPNAIAFDHDGNLIVPNATSNRVHRVSKEGSKTTILTNIENPTGIAVDSVGNIFISQYQLSKISKLDTAGTLSTFLTGGLLNGPVSLIFDENWDLYIGNFNDGRVLKYSNESLSIIGDISGWLGSFTLTEDAIYAAAFQGHRIYKMSKNGGSQTVFAGTGSKGSKDGLLSEASFNGPNGIAASATGDTLYISDFETRSLRMITGLIPNNPKLSIQDTLNFGEQSIGIEKTELKIEIRNNGNDTLKIEDFIFSNTSFGTTVESMLIPPYSVDSLTITFDAKEVGEFSSTLEIHSNTKDEIHLITLVSIVVASTPLESSNEIPNELKLYQNFPNPFNPSTMINFQIPEAASVTLDVFDMQGRKIATLVDNEISSGSHSVRFEGVNLSSGVYYCRLGYNGLTETIKMTLIK